MKTFVRTHRHQMIVVTKTMVIKMTMVATAADTALTMKRKRNNAFCLVLSW